MKVVVLYHPLSDHARDVEAFAHDIEARYASTVEQLSVDTRAGAEFAAVYDIVAYPAVIALDDSGGLLSLWQSGGLPLVSDVAYYLQTSFSSHNL